MTAITDHVYLAAQHHSIFKTNGAHVPYSEALTF